VPARIPDGLGQTAGLRPLLSRWRGQLASFPADGGIAAARQAGIRLICPGDPEIDNFTHDGSRRTAELPDCFSGVLPRSCSGGVAALEGARRRAPGRRVRLVPDFQGGRHFQFCGSGSPVRWVTCGQLRPGTSSRFASNSAWLQRLKQQSLGPSTKGNLR
jgi:hypothetical protein